MSLKKNIIANYVSQLYVTAVGILILPFYIKHLGAEAYGLVGFFVLLQAWFNLLDLGLTPTISRETARFKAGVMSALSFRQIYRALSLIFLFIAVVGGISLFLLAEILANNWLQFDSLSLFSVVIAIKIMAAIVALRWLCGLYRGVITGSESLIWLSYFNIAVATFRTVGVFPIMFKFGFTISVFFIYQLFIALLESLILFYKSRILLPKLSKFSEPIGWSVKPLMPVLKFSMTIAFTASIWVLVTQTDKLILSSILPLAEYGYFTLAVLVAGGIMIISGPISNALLPRMTSLFAQEKHLEMLAIYRNATQFVAVIAGSCAITMFFCAENLLYAWTGDLHLSHFVAPILRLYVIGNGFLVIAAFPYYLQYAKGNLKYHLYGNLILVGILVPLIVLAAKYYGAIGAGYTWMTINFLFLIFWVAFIHYKIEPGLHLKWLFNDVFILIFPAACIGYFFNSLNFSYSTRLDSFLILLIVGIPVLLTSLLCSPLIRKYINKKYLTKVVV
ncbi:polysaccharide biosynthesis protein [Shewanella morhuae]|uniref:Polysaccharide biosynthesis protein n=1 Tax=Shewanella morhuae TaxID=365591 RepID=A0ABX5HV06_9GAMM|nr:oligosaccharide flippase family protein [Shewanella morhuae]PTA50726.1 polysaccharide biosynthesis protein [Shewanella morhuae]